MNLKFLHQLRNKLNASELKELIELIKSLKEWEQRLKDEDKRIKSERSALTSAKMEIKRKL